MDATRSYGGPAGHVPRFQTVAEAAQSQNTEAVMDMLASGFDVNAPDMDGNTALHWASWFKLDDLVGRLLERGARPELPNAAGEATVHWAAKAANIQALEAMTRIDHSLLSVRDCDGFTPFVILAQNDCAPVMEWLYLKGISVEEQDNLGRTGLQWACYKGHRRTVQYLLSRSANISHRDHEGMTAVHWAALKGHEQVADMLVNVGAVHLLDAPDGSGDTPLSLARRKKNRYMVISFLKCQLLEFIIGRPHLSHNNFANLFFAFLMFNILVFLAVVLPEVVDASPGAAALWTFLAAAVMIVWARACRSDPGWLAEKTVQSQSERLATDSSNDPNGGYDSEQPVESQFAYADDRETMETEDLIKLELEQSKFNFQRQLINAARSRLEDNVLCGVYEGGGHSARSVGHSARTEFQPLVPAMPANCAFGELPAPQSQRHHIQLDRAASELQRRERNVRGNVARRRVNSLLAMGRGEYIELIEKGQFKQVCPVCRVRRELRSHHCKECGRCVRRLDHHCPWIDNCVGLGNQRTFFFFILLLLATILQFFYLALLYVSDAILPSFTETGIRKAFSTMFSGGFGPELRPLLVFVACAFDCVWLAFVAALVVRHTAYMAVNVTTYEVLVRPAHVQRRFPRSSGRLWFLDGWSMLQAINNCMNFWTLNFDEDGLDFAPSHDFAPPTSEEAYATRRPRRGGGVNGGDYMPGRAAVVSVDDERGSGCTPRLDADLLLRCDRTDDAAEDGAAQVGVDEAMPMPTTRPP